MKRQIIIIAICIITMLPAMAEQTETLPLFSTMTKQTEAPQLYPAVSEQTGIPQFEGYQRNIFVGLLFSANLNFFLDVNYDMRLNPGRMDGIGFRVGIGGISAEGRLPRGGYVSVGIITFPIEFNHVLGKKRHSFVSGIGIVPIFLSADTHGEAVKIDNKEFEFDGSVFGFGTAYLSLGYRWQPLGDGIIFQVHWNPLIGYGGFDPLCFGVGIGASFKQ